MSEVPLRVVALIRMSTDEQVASPDRQRQLFADYCDRYDLRPVGEYADEGVSATHVPMERRKSLMTLLEDARRRRFELVWSEELSRIARKPEEWFVIRAELAKHGVAIVSGTENPREARESSIREFTQGLFAILARFEARNLGDRLRRTQQVNVSQGKYRGGPLPPGLAWDKQEGCYTINEDTQPLAVRVFELYVTTGSLQETARRLDAEGFCGANGHRMSGATVQKILDCSAYRGKRLFAGELYDTQLPQVVPPELVAEVDQRLANLSIRPQRTTELYTNSAAIFAGLLKCPQCGGWLRVHSCRPRGERTYISYDCARSHRPPIGCGWRHSIAQISFEREILPVLAAELKGITKRLTTPGRGGKARQQQQRQRRRIEEERERALQQHRRGWITDEQAEVVLRQLDERAVALEDETAPAVVAVTDEQVKEAADSLERQWKEWGSASKRELLQTLVESITPNRDCPEKSEIRWRID